MIAKQANDKCYSIINNGDTTFNFDRAPRTEIPLDLARGAFAFKIEKRQSYDHDGWPVPNHYHLVRDDDGQYVPSLAVTDKYVPVQHLDVFNYVTGEIFPEIPELKLEIAGTIRGGSVGLMAAKFGDTFALPGDRSPNETRLLWYNPCTGRGATSLGFTTVRIVCQNTLTAAVRQIRADGNGYSVHHTGGADMRIRDAVAGIRDQIESARAVRDRSERLARIQANTAMLTRVLDRLYPLAGVKEGRARTFVLNRREEVMRQFDGGETAETMTQDTAWKLFNSVTFNIFNPTRMGNRTDLAEIHYSGMTGSVAQDVRRIFTTVEDVALAA